MDGWGVWGWMEGGVSDGREMWRGDTIKRHAKRQRQTKGKMWKSRDKRDESMGLKLSLGCVNFKIRIRLGFILQYCWQYVCK